jgi:hypothetical protein
LFDNPDYRPIIGIAVLGAVVGIYVTRRLSEPGPLVRGEARWRYRSRPVGQRIAATRSALASRLPPMGWWTTRIELGIAIAAAFVPPLMVPVVTAPTFRDESPLMALAALGLAEAGILVGLAWMIRIYRAPLNLDAGATWRYRDRPDGSQRP